MEVSFDMSEPKEHHYLPQVYLRGFSKDNSLWLFDRQTRKCHQVTPKQVAKKKHFYSVKRKDGTIDTSAEKTLGFIDGAMAGVLKKIESRIELDNEDIGTLSIFVAFQMLRVPHFRNEYEDMICNGGKQVLDKSISSREQVRKTLDAIGRKSDDEAVDSLIEFVKSGEYTMRANNAHYVGLLLQFGLELSRKMFEFAFVVFTADAKERFITCDNPLTIRDMVPGRSRFMKAGVLTPGTFKIFPLSSRSCLVFADESNAFAYGPTSDDSVRMINEDVLRNATRYAFAEEQSFLEDAAAIR